MTDVEEEEEEELKGAFPKKTGLSKKQITFNFSADADNEMLATYSPLGEDLQGERSRREANAYIAAYVRGRRRDFMLQEEKSRRDANDYIAAFVRGEDNTWP